MEPKKPIKKNKTDFVPLTLRLPPALHASIVEQATVANKSLNEYIVNLLSEYPGLKIERDKLLNETNERLIDMDRRLIVLEARGEAISTSDIATFTVDPADFPPAAKE